MFAYVDVRRKEKEKSVELTHSKALIDNFFFSSSPSSVPLITDAKFFVIDQ
jgi:hypothetical protein